MNFMLTIYRSALHLPACFTVRFTAGQRKDMAIAGVTGMYARISGIRLRAFTCKPKPFTW
ncbi:MAG TPA: hypothetical protein PKH94_02820 [Bacteroidales bacterium]|nr:hypothetical protein [Bacteroidales bacterium]